MKVVFLILFLVLVLCVGAVGLITFIPKLVRKLCRKIDVDDVASKKEEMQSVKTVGVLGDEARRVAPDGAAEKVEQDCDAAEEALAAGRNASERLEDM